MRDFADADDVRAICFQELRIRTAPAPDPHLPDNAAQRCGATKSGCPRPLAEKNSAGVCSCFTSAQDEITRTLGILRGAIAERMTVCEMMDDVDSGGHQWQEEVAKDGRLA